MVLKYRHIMSTRPLAPFVIDVMQRFTKSSSTGYFEVVTYMPYTAVRGLSSHSATIASEARIPMAIIDVLFIETVLFLDIHLLLLN